MSDVTVVCPSCSALLKPAGPAPAGKKFRCPKCQGVVEVPASAGNKPAAPVTPAAPPAKAPAVPPSALARAEIQPAVAPAPRPKMTPVPPPPRRSKLPLVLGVLLLFLFIACGGVATGGYFAWGWYKQWDASRTRAANNQPAPPTTSRQEAETFPTPDAALDAYVKALPDAERDAEWADGKFQRFPAEFDGDDQAHIVCVVRGGPDAADTYRKYAFAKRDGGWRHTDRTTGDYKDLDPKRYAVAWNKPPDPPRGFDLAGETKKALAGVTLKPLDVKLGHLQMTLQAPAGATVEDNGFEVAVTHGERFTIVSWYR